MSDFKAKNPIPIPAGAPAADIAGGAYSAPQTF